MQRFITSCPIGCNAELETTKLVLPEGPLLRCTACGQLISQASPERYWESMSEFDAPQGTLPSAKSQGRRFELGKKWLERIESLAGKPKSEIRLLDVGCSSGAFLMVAKQLGFQGSGVEPAPKAAQAAISAGLDVHQGLLQEVAFADDSFDAITLFEVIEHLQQPLDLLKECRRILRPGGILLIGTGNTQSWTVGANGADWEYFRIDNHGGHVSFYNPKSMTLLANRAGFAVARLDTRNVRLVEKDVAAQLRYRLAKIASELLSFPARMLGRGHDMQAYLRK